ncbi:MAG TPA: ATP-binding protein, partial [Accumulibacter sp.]|nr:ATP-binding protein [Accumulibacter sp.]
MRLRFSITVSLIALFAVLAALAQWTALLVSHQALQATVRAREIDKMLTVGRVVEELVVEQARRARLTARLTARRNSLGRSLAQSGEAAVETVREVLDEALAASAVAQMEIADSRQLVVYRAHERARNGDLSEVWGVFEALAGQGQMASAIDNGVVTVQAIEPVDWKGKVVGALVAGVRIDSSLLAKIGEDLGADLFLIARTGALLASSQSVPYTLDQAAIQEAFTQKIPVYRHEMQAHRTLAYLPLTIVDNAFVIVAVLDSAQAYEMLARANERSLLITLGILLVSVLLGSALVRWVLRPLRALRERAEASAVALTGSAIESGSSNEIAAIVKVLETLTDRLVRRNRELAEATQAAEHASKAKSQFLSNMSHEIRTPLNGILGMAEVLARTPLAAEQARYLRAITSAGQSLHALLGDILDLAKIEAGRIVVEQIDFDLMTVLVPMADAFREIASVHGNVLSSDLRIPASLEVNGDPTRLRQVLSNLLSNAIKFTEHGRVLLAAERLADRDGDTRLWLRFVVRDSGIGIAPEALARLFQPFVQADQSTTRRYGGSGLGLVICRHLVELMGGSISVESTPGAGSTFTVDLPFAAALAPVASSGSGAGSRQTLNGRVLVAEDNPVNQSVIEAMLGELGVTVTIVANGAAAVEALPGGAFDLVLMDCQMPVMDGYAATAAIRAGAGALARVPI